MNEGFIILICFAIFMFLIGFILNMVSRHRKKGRTYKVTGEIYDPNGAVSYSFKQDDPHVMKTFHHGMYVYQYQGVSYTAISTIGTTKRPKPGKKTTIYINPDNPEDYIMDCWLYNLLTGMFYALGVLFVVILIIIAIV